MEHMIRNENVICRYHTYDKPVNPWGDLHSISAGATLRVDNSIGWATGTVDTGYISVSGISPIQVGGGVIQYTGTPPTPNYYYRTGDQVTISGSTSIGTNGTWVVQEPQVQRYDGLESMESYEEYSRRQAQRLYMEQQEQARHLEEHRTQMALAQAQAEIIQQEQAEPRRTIADMIRSLGRGE